MSRKYLPVTGEKPMFLPLDMQSWVPKDHFAWFLVDVVQQLDTSALQAGTSPGRGRPGYDPQMLATLVMYAMSCGERSSREIEDRTRTDAGFRVASGNQFPDHSTLCRFRQRAGAGLGRLRVISVDGPAAQCSPRSTAGGRPWTCCAAHKRAAPPSPGPLHRRRARQRESAEIGRASGRE